MNVANELKDLFEAPRMAFKWLEWTGKEFKSMSYGDNAVWTDGKLVAKCNNAYGINPAHVAPQESCGCGIYGVKSLDGADHYGTHSPNAVGVLFQGGAPGYKTILASDGLRAGCAVIKYVVFGRGDKPADIAVDVAEQMLAQDWGYEPRSYKALEEKYIIDLLKKECFLTNGVQGKYILVATPQGEKAKCIEEDSLYLAAVRSGITHMPTYGIAHKPTGRFVTWIGKRKDCIEFLEQFGGLDEWGNVCDRILQPDWVKSMQERINQFHIGRGHADPLEPTVE